MAQDRFLENHKNFKGIDFVGEPFKIRTAKISISNYKDDSETGTDFTLPSKAVVYDVFLDVLTAEATGTGKTLDVGTDSDDSGDADGYLVGVDVSSTGLVKGTVDMTDVDGTSTTLGALLAETNTTNDTAIKLPDIASGGKEITYTADNADWEEFEGNLYVVYAIV